MKVVNGSRGRSLAGEGAAVVSGVGVVVVGGVGEVVEGWCDVVGGGASGVVAVGVDGCVFGAGRVVVTASSPEVQAATRTKIRQSVSRRFIGPRPSTRAYRLDHYHCRRGDGQSRTA